MTEAVPGLRWLAPFILAVVSERSDLRRSVEVYWQDSLDWRWAESDDWPSEWRVTGDFAHAKNGGFGFVANLGSKRLFAVPRGWSEPEWELAEVGEGGHWRDLGYFEPWAPTWVWPDLADHPSRSVR